VCIATLETKSRFYGDQGQFTSEEWQMLIKGSCRAVAVTAFSGVKRSTAHTAWIASWTKPSPSTPKTLDGGGPQLKAIAEIIAFEGHPHGERAEAFLRASRQTREPRDEDVVVAWLRQAFSAETFAYSSILKRAQTVFNVEALGSSEEAAGRHDL
jgi:hypothetical protein